jgi:heptaprenylglyceryl phosphate synthase
VGRSSIPAFELGVQVVTWFATVHVLAGNTVGVQVRYLESHCPAQTSPMAETVTRGSDDVNLIVGCGETAFGVLF